MIAGAVLLAAGAGGYTVYQQKAEEKAFEDKMTKTISGLKPIEVFEKSNLPSVAEQFKGTESVIDIDSVQPDISNVSTTEPGEYEVKYSFNDVKGNKRTASVKCIVKPELESHVEGLGDIIIDKGDELPTEPECTFDDYVSAVTLNTDSVDKDEAGTYDITYTILGTDGEMKTVDGYVCVVNEVAPPTPTPTPSPSPTPTPKPENPTEDSQNGNTQDEDDTAVGHVIQNEEVVETGDENNLLLIGAVIVVCIGAVIGVIVWRKKKF